MAKNTTDYVPGFDEEPSVAETPDVVEVAVKAALDNWIVSHLRDSDFSRDTAAWNHFRNGLPALIEGITKEVNQK